MNKSDQKYSLFEYFVFQLNEWKKELEQKKETVGEFDTLRLFKILFLVSAYNTDEQNHILLDVFNNFYALPYGPVESDIYNAMKNNDSTKFQHLRFSGWMCDMSGYENLTENDFNDVVDKELKKALCKSIRGLKEIGVKYLTMNVFRLIDLTHEWTVWQIAYQKARARHQWSYPMRTEDIWNNDCRKVF